MNYLKQLAIGITFLCTAAATSAQAYKKLHKKATLIDTHNDVLSSQVLKGKDISTLTTEGHSDLDRWKAGGLNVQFFSVWTDKKPRNKEGFYADANEEIDSLQRLILRNLPRMTLALKYRDVIRGIRHGKLVSLIGVEGGHMIEDDLEKLNTLYKRGMRYLTLTWNNSTSWASSAMDETLRPDSLTKKGLNDFGKQVVKRLNELGAIVDLSHVGEQTFYDALAVTTKPVLLSHSSVWKICPVFRNVKDDQIRAVARNGGVICVNFYAGFISAEYDKRSDELSGLNRKRIMDSLSITIPDSMARREAWRKYYRSEMDKVRPTIAQLVDHIDYIVKMVGDDYVGIGSDFDGISALPVGLDDVSTYPLITKELLNRGYSRTSIKKILGQNVLRVMKENFK